MHNANKRKCLEDSWRRKNVSFNKARKRHGKFRAQDGIH